MSAKAKILRKNSTIFENKLWYYLRNRIFFNLKFRRQFAVENFVADFVCLKKRIVIELDGSQHNTEKSIIQDCIRDEIIEKNNFKVLRFWNNDLQDIDAVLETIAIECGVLNK